jgi:hypothetical protein
MGEGVLVGCEISFWVGGSDAVLVVGSYGLGLGYTTYICFMKRFVRGE